MIKFFIKKLRYMILILIGVSILTFSLGRLAPGDPVQSILADIDKPLTEEVIDDAREKMGLNKSIPQQYFIWLSGILKGDFGTCIKSGQKVTYEISRRIGPTIELTLASTIIMLLISFPLGILSAVFKDRIPDRIIKFLNTVNISFPTFCVGIILILVLGVRMKLFPVMGREGLKSLVLPSLTLGISMSGGLIRLIRNELLKNMEKDYVQTAVVLGVKKTSVVINNVILNSMIAIVTNVGLYIGALLGGSTIIENLFGWPGLGNFMIQSIYNRDYAVIQAYAILMAVIYVVINMLVDMICYNLNPKMKGDSYGK